MISFAPVRIELRVYSQADVLGRFGGSFDETSQEQPDLVELHGLIALDRRLVEVLMKNSTMISPLLAVRHVSETEVPADPMAALSANKQLVCT